MDDNDESEEFQLMNNRGEGNGAADAPPFRAARSVSPDDLVETFSDGEDRGDLDQFGIGPTNFSKRVISRAGASLSSQSKPRPVLDARVASKFKIRACSGPSCVLSSSNDLDQEAVNAYDVFVRLAQDRAPTVQVEESSVCLRGGDGCPSNDGGCCVEVRHEQSSKVRRYANLKTESDVERVFSCVEAAIRAISVKQGSASGG